MSDIVNIILIVVFGTLAVVMFTRYFKNHRRIMIEDQQWSYIRIMFLVVGVLSIISLLSMKGGSILDYIRIVIMIISVSAYMIVRDGVGEDGMLSGGKFYPWDQVMAYDYRVEKNIVAVYFMIESTDEKKKDEYTTKELDFSINDKDVLLKFLELNLGRKYTRMKKKAK